LNRRQFLQSTAASYVLTSFGLRAETNSSKFVESDNAVKFRGINYLWEWSAETDEFRILNQRSEVIARGPLQPVVLVQSRLNQTRRAVTGKLVHHKAEEDRAVWTYAHANANGGSRVTVAWRFSDRGAWKEPITYESAAEEDIVSVHWFAETKDDLPHPGLRTANLVLPGICESEGVSPIISDDIGLELRTSLGRAGSGITQQWGLPCHYFAGFREAQAGRPDVPAPPDTTEAYCCGLTDLPGADLYFDQKDGRGSVVFNYRGDLWGHLRGPGPFTLGAGLYWAFAPNYYEAIREYYRGLLDARIIRKQAPSSRKTATLLAPQWCTWGEQMVDKKDGSSLDQTALEKFYRDLKSSGLRASLLSIDDKWEGKYGALEHSVERLPRFEQFLEELREDGLRLGLWAAFMRSEDPTSLGLTSEQMLRKVDGSAYFIKDGQQSWYILDFTRSEVQEVLRERARRFVRRYKPDLVKFDFGYEIPVLDEIAPHDMHWAGEKMLAKGLEVVVGAMREENPDIVVMYYHLSPLFTEYLDLHSPDDLGLTKGEYDLEANRRFFFSGLCAEFGTPTYGSSGYDWRSAPEIWFDSVAIGTVGSIVSFDPSDDAGERATPQMIAKFNGMTQLIRPTTDFRVQALDPVFGNATRGAHASSWVRFEKEKPVLVALRTQRLDSGRGRNECEFAKTTAPMVVASKTNDSLDQSSHLGVVPYGDGTLTLTRKSAGSVRMAEHCFSGKSFATRLPIQNATLEIPLRQQIDSDPVEWIEIEIDPSRVG